jgi:hypothetical protein
MHVDHGSLLNLSSNGLIGKVAVCATLVASYRAIYSNRHGETSASRSRVHPQIAWAKLRDGAAIASKR